MDFYGDDAYLIMSPLYVQDKLLEAGTTSPPIGNYDPFPVPHVWHAAIDPLSCPERIPAAPPMVHAPPPVRRTITKANLPPLKHLAGRTNRVPLKGSILEHEATEAQLIVVVPEMKPKSRRVGATEPKSKCRRVGATSPTSVCTEGGSY